MNNFECNNCGYQFFISHFIISIKNDIAIYKYKTGKPVSCPDCNSLNIKTIEKPGNFETLQVGKYTMLSVDDRKKLLKKRSHEHFEKEIKHKQHEINANPGLQTLG